MQSTTHRKKVLNFYFSFFFIKTNIENVTNNSQEMFISKFTLSQTS